MKVIKDFMRMGEWRRGETVSKGVDDRQGKLVLEKLKQGKKVRKEKRRERAILKK